MVPDDCAVDDVDVDEAPPPDVGRVDVLGALMDWVTETVVGDEDLTTGDRVWYTDGVLRPPWDVVL